MINSPNSNDALLEINNVEVIYDHVILVLKGVSLNVRKGTIVALLGANGAGKTTAMRMLCGLSVPTSGDAKVAGFDIYKETESIKKSGLFFVGLDKLVRGIKLYEGKVIEQLVACGLKLDACRSGLAACCSYLQWLEA